MNHIAVRLLGSPMVRVNGDAVCFPYRKAEGIFYYLCIKKAITREEAISIFWASTDEKTARKNLRDVIYKIRKLLGEETLQVVGSTLKLNPDVPIDIDTDRITPENIIAEGGEDFLHYFYVKNCNEFEDWCEGVRAYYHNLYIAGLHSRLSNMVKTQNIDQIKRYAGILIQNDIYSEGTYREIMRTYLQVGQYNLAIKLYYELKEVLFEDLEEEPDEETQQLFRQVLERKESYTQSSARDVDYFYGRHAELMRLSACIGEFTDGKSCSVLISGEAGVGKTTFLKRASSLIDTGVFTVLRYDCAYSEKDLHLRAWCNLFTRLQEHIGAGVDMETPHGPVLAQYLQEMTAMNPQTLEQMDFGVEIVSDAVSALAQHKKIILLFDDIQWMDSASLRLLGSMLKELGSERIILIASFREDYEQELDHFTVPLDLSGDLRQITLQRFSLEETGGIIQDLAPWLGEDSALIDNIYRDTEGNPLFLTELLAVIKDKGYTRRISNKSTNIIKSRLIDLSGDERNLLEALSLFPGGASMADLKIFFPMTELEIYVLLEKLIAKHLVREASKNKDVIYSFGHQWIQEYVHQSQSIGKRVMLHRRIATFYEQQFGVNRASSLYGWLIYHFEQCGDLCKTYHYQVEYLRAFYNTRHDIYPGMASGLDPESGTDILVDKEHLLRLEEKIGELEEGVAEHQSLKMRLYFVLGRYAIFSGRYSEGLEYIHTSLRLAQELQHDAYLRDNYKQMIYYGIQVSDIDVMKQYLDQYAAVQERCTPEPCETAQMMRLQGLYLTEVHDYGNAEKILGDAICLLRAHLPASSKSMDLAVCYNYLGKSRLEQGDLPAAFEHFSQAIELCDKRYVTNGLGIFYSNASQALCEMQRYDEAANFNRNANECFASTNVLWERARAESYAALIESRRGNVALAQEYIAKARKTSAMLRNPTVLKQLDAVEKRLAAAE